MSADRTDRGRAGRAPAVPSVRYSVGRATDAFSVPFAGGLLSYRAGQRIVAHSELRRLIETHQFPVRFEDD